jgi:O-antigen ligase
MTTARFETRIGILRRPQVTDWLTFLAVVLFSAGAYGLATLAPKYPYLALLPFVGLAAAIVLWRHPIVALFTFVVAATQIENYRLHFADSITDNIGFWRNLSSSGLKGVPVSPAEILMVIVLLIWLLRHLFAQTLEVRTSPLFRSYGIYLLAVVCGLLHGFFTRANTTIALWEIRTQVYGIVFFFLALNLLKTRRHFEVLSWVIMLGTGLKGVQGTYRYFVTLGGHFEGNSLLGHDEAFFFPAYYIFVLLLFVFGGSRRQKLTGLALLPFVMIAEFANNRRTSTALVVICVAVLWFILFSLLKKRRLRIASFAIVGLTFSVVYGAVGWNRNSTYFQPVQAIRSQIAPSARDASSDLYRLQEDRNLMHAVKLDPIFGRGYGIRMENIAGMVDLSQESTEFLFYFPHNSILWIWWRTGLIGFVLFWIAMGLALVRNCFLARATSDPYLRRWAIFAITVTIMRLLVGWWDQGIYMYRVSAYVWIVLAVPEILGASLLTGAGSGSLPSDTEGAR